MILAAVALLAALAAPFTSHAAPAVLGRSDAKLLLERTGFGASPRDIDTYAKLSREEAVQRLIAGVRTQPLTSPPAWVGYPFDASREARGTTPEERQAWMRQRRERRAELRAWWLDEMLRTPSPLTERMTLFWHNHFVSSDQKVPSMQLMYRQNALFRANALGDFRTLLHEVVRDPAMVIYLDSASNAKARPNENFARELMELFTLGEGNYTEQDVKEAARAFTGFSIDREVGTFLFRPAQHDYAEKTVLGHSGPLDGNDVVDILLADPRTAELIVAKLWREFISPVPDRAEVKRIAERFRAASYDMRVPVRDILLNPALYDARNRAALVKSPADLVIGTMRAFQFEHGDLLPITRVMASLGQNLFAPPNVKGWAGGEAWINSARLLARKQFLQRAFAGTGTPQRPGMTSEGAAQPSAAGRAPLGHTLAFDADRWLASLSDAQSSALQDAVLAIAPVQPVTASTDPVETLRGLTQDPAYQLK